MSSKYKFINPEAVYFVTSTVGDGADFLAKNVYKENLLDSYRFCQNGSNNTRLVIKFYRIFF